MELGPRSHNKDGLVGPNSIVVSEEYMDPLRNDNARRGKTGFLEGSMLGA